MDRLGDRAWMVLLAGSGAASLGYEAVWLRRLGLLLGGTATAGAVTVGAFMGGLALGGAWSSRLGRERPVATYAALEAFAGGWALAFPWLLAAAAPWAAAPGPARYAVAVGLLLPPATALGATWPLLARGAGGPVGAGLYASNTAGAVLGVLLTTFWWLPTVGVRATEVACAALGLTVALGAGLAGRPPAGRSVEAPPPSMPVPTALAAGAVAGLSALGLEVVWMRLAAIALGPTVQATGWVLATFLGMVAAGAALGRRWPADPTLGVTGGLAALGALALLGATSWGQLPLLVAAIWRLGGPEAMLPGSALVAAVAMAGAPAASGLVFSCLTRGLGSALPRHAGALYGLNAVGSTAGAWIGGLWALPVLEPRGAVLLFAGAAAIAAALVARRPWPALPALLLALVLPAWDARLYAVGVHLRISDFADPSNAAIRRFTDEGWQLLLYDHGPTGAVAVGRSDRTGNRWLSIDGKVDASTGDDMPTQVLSAELPLRLSAHPERVLVVGLASGITAGTALRDPRVRSLTVAELEPAVVDASRLFDDWSGAPLDDPRTTLVLDDARALLTRTDQRFDVVISEPSNPWISGVSNLFTREYWQLARSRLAPGGVMCQWVQLYGLGPEELRGLLRTFLEVFPDARLFETIEGADVLLIGGGSGDPADLPVAPLLGPEGLRAVAGEGWSNTDDRPRVEWAAPRWLHYDTGPGNSALLRAGVSPEAARP